MEKISATVITRNEERNLERCLNALSGVADEIIVVDSYSDDSTLEICKKYGCKITQREFKGFGSQRQYATGLTTNKYVLSIDADEVIDEELRSRLLEMKEKGFDHRVYSVNVVNYFCGKALRHSGFKPTQSVRLFNKRYANWNLRDVCDRISYSDSVNPAILPGAIHHYRNATVEEFVKKENRLASMQARVLAASKKHISIITPRYKACVEYLSGLIFDRAWMDGKYGLLIARQRSKTVYEAWHMARHILQDKQG